MRNWMSNRCARLSAGVLTGALAIAATADTIKASFDEVSPRRDFSYSLNGDSNETKAGIFHWKSEAGGTLDLGNFESFCIELTQHTSEHVLFDVVDLADGTMPGDGIDGHDTNGPMGSAKADLIRELWGRHHADIYTGTDDEKRDKSAAFQIGVWECVYDQGLDLDDGGFKANDGSSDPVMIAKGWLGELNGNTDYFANDLAGLTSREYQDQVTQIPEPTSLILIGMGVLGLIRRR